MSVHGANRLGANSLLDIVVFGRACAHHIKETLTPGKPHKSISETAGVESIEFLDKIRNSDGPEPTAKIRLAMQKAMQSDAAVFRLAVLLACLSRFCSLTCAVRKRRSTRAFIKSARSTRTSAMSASRTVA